MKTEARIIPSLFDRHDLLRRHVIILLMTMFFESLNIIVKPEGWSGEWFKGLVFNFMYIATIWNGNIFLIGLLHQRISMTHEIRKFLWFTGIIALALPIAVHYVYNLIVFPLLHGHPCALGSKESITNLIVSVAITLLVNAVFAAYSFFTFWRRSIEEKEELKREGISAEFETLKNQINPHFLFNSLNTLTSLIEESPATATDFVQKLAGVYRYVLTQKDKELTTLEEELNFIRSYIYLNQIRFGENLKAEYIINPTSLKKKVVTLSLQMVIENAIKHNVISRERPLTISIRADAEQVEVRNNLQKKNAAADSNGIGLSNIITRYALLTEREVRITEDEYAFTVQLPLLEDKG